MQVHKFKFTLFNLFIYFFSVSNFTFAQQNQIDSLKQLLKKTMHDTSRCSILSQLTETASDEEWPKFNEQLKNLTNDNLKRISKERNASIEFQKSNHIETPLIKVYKKHYSLAVNNDGQICVEKGEFLKALEYHRESLKIREEIGDKHDIAESLNNLGAIYYYQGDIRKALELYSKSLNIMEDIDNKRGIADALNNLGNIYEAQDEVAKALECAKKSLSLYEELGYKKGISTSMNNIALVYQKLNNIPKTLEYHFKSQKIKEEMNDKEGLAFTLTNIASVFFSQQDYQKALQYYFKTNKLYEQVENKMGIASTLNDIGYIHFKQKKYNQAIEYCNKSMKLSKELGIPTVIKNAAGALHRIYKATGNSTKALENYELYIKMRDSLNNVATKKASIKTQLKYEYDKKALADSLQLAETKKISKAQLAESTAKLKQEKTQRFALLAGLILVFVFLTYTYSRFRQSQKQKLLIEQQKIVVDQSQKKIVDSINYAKKIQNSILPSSEEISAVFPNHFLFFKPKDIVSGDFYWFYHHNNLSFVAVADCTGHGVPGAFMTMIASAGLNEVIIEQNITQPDLILSSLHSTIFKSLQQHKGDEYSQDGLDLSLAVIDHKNNLLHFSGAHNHGFLIDKGEIRTLKASPKSIGGLNILGEIEPQRKFKGESYQLNKDSVLILSTDGIYDQLNPQDEKFNIQRFKDLILKLNSDDNIANLNMVEETFNNWKKETPQLDDVLMLTIKL